MRKSGKVINFDDDKVYIVTNNKEFVTLERNDKAPIKGNIYDGTVYVDRSNLIKVFIILSQYIREYLFTLLKFLVF